jgi:GcrA cell cycle regulator
MAEAGMTWTEERVDLLRKLWGEGLSAGQIAAELGGAMTRNAVISKAHRLGLAHGRATAPSTPRSRKPSPPPEPSETVEPPAQNDPSPAPMMLNQVPAAQPAELPLRKEAVVPLSEGVTIMELREGVCRWPLGDPTTAEFRYCGGGAISGLPSCAHHAQVAYQPATERKRLRA